MLTRNLSVILFLFVANLSDRVKMRSPFILGGMVVALVGFAINIADVSNGAKYFGVFLCILGLFGGMPSLFAWYDELPLIFLAYTLTLIT